VSPFPGVEQCPTDGDQKGQPEAELDLSTPRLEKMPIGFSRATTGRERMWWMAISAMQASSGDSVWSEINNRNFRAFFSEDLC
jgi:hypothetical protein